MWGTLYCGHERILCTYKPCTWSHRSIYLLMNVESLFSDKFFSFNWTPSPSYQRKVLVKFSPPFNCLLSFASNIWRVSQSVLSFLSAKEFLDIQKHCPIEQELLHCQPCCPMMPCTSSSPHPWSQGCPPIFAVQLKGTWELHSWGGNCTDCFRTQML